MRMIKQKNWVKLMHLSMFGGGGGYNFKTSAFWGGKFFSGKKHEEGQILWHSNSSLGNLTSVIYPRVHKWVVSFAAVFSIITQRSFPPRCTQLRVGCPHVGRSVAWRHWKPLRGRLMVVEKERIWRDFRSRGKGCLTWSRKSLAGIFGPLSF